MPLTGPIQTVMSLDGQLSPELNEKILDLLTGDYKTLAACTLVCSGWRTRSQYLLFRRLKLVFAARANRNLDHNGEKFDGFIYRLQKTILANPSIVDKVHDLVVEFKPKVTRTMIRAYGVNAEMPLNLPFTHLESLHIRYGEDFDNVHLQIRRVRRLCLFLQSNPSLRRIIMDPIILNQKKSVEFLTTLGSLPHLTDLAWKGAWCSAEGYCQVDLPTKRLCWYSHGTTSYRRIFGAGSAIKLPQLEELALLSEWSRPRGEVMWFLQTCAATLRHLTVSLEDIINCPDEILKSLRCLSHLQLLDARGRMFGSEYLPLEAKLSQICTLRSVSIILPRLEETIQREIPAASWADRALANLQSSSASQMVPEINVCVWDEVHGRVQIDADISERVFPKASQLGLFKGILPSFWWPSSFLMEVMGSGYPRWVRSVGMYTQFGGDYDGDRMYQYQSDHQWQE